MAIQARPLSPSLRLQNLKASDPLLHRPPRVGHQALSRPHPFVPSTGSLGFQESRLLLTSFALGMLDSSTLQDAGKGRLHRHLPLQMVTARFTVIQGDQTALILAE